MSSAIPGVKSWLRAGTRVLGGMLLLSGLGSIAHARVVPEIDPGTAHSALMLLVGSVLVIAGKVRK